MNAMGEHDEEPVRGLPEVLPADEKILWQGAPRWEGLACDAFHVRKLAVYFGVILLLRGITSWSNGHTVLEAFVAALWLLPVALAAMGVLTLLAWLTARTTVYTITNRRVVMRIGIVLTMSLNLPFRMIASAGLRARQGGNGDIPLLLASKDHLAYLHLWPHVRPWRLAHPEPMLRSVPDVAHVGDILATALAAAVGGTTRSAVHASASAAPGIGAPVRELGTPVHEPQLMSGAH